MAEHQKGQLKTLLVTNLASCLVTLLALSTYSLTAKRQPLQPLKAVNRSLQQECCTCTDQASNACCSWDYGTCGTDAWCNALPGNCETCGGFYIQPANLGNCAPMWNGCQSSTDCCGDAVCLFDDGYSGWKHCNLPSNLGYDPICCSWDYDGCGTDVWCNDSSGNCGQCGGFYINPFALTGCTSMWNECQTSEECCGVSECLNDGGWRHCNIPANVAPSPPMLPAPSPPPTTTTQPVPNLPSPTVAPTPLGPVSVPTPPPVGPGPTSSPDGLIRPGLESERVTLPYAPDPVAVSRQGCPHEQGGLTDWQDLFSAAQSGSDVQIPSNTKVVVRRSVPNVLGVIRIPASSELIIGENVNGINLDVRGMDVEGGLVIGSETCLVETKVIITLYGPRPNNPVVNIPEPTFKGISVSGTISLHGKQVRTWSRLATTVFAGDSSFRLQHDVTWSQGDEIVLVTTAMKDSKEWHQNEVLTVASVDNSPAIGSIVYIQGSVQYKHVGIQAYQAEVGLLTRSIVIQGSSTDSEPVDPDPLNCQGNERYGDSARPCGNTALTGFGGHIIVHDGGRGFVEGVELFRMGQTNVLGRYPIHFHLLGDCPECYFKRSSVHRSYYRCISIHGTNQMEASENVAFDVQGYCYYLEDGVEEFNSFLYNLGAHIHMIGPELPDGGGQTTQTYPQSDTLTLPADITASAFYITNVRNNVIGNAASGGWAGFAFPNLPEPLGQSRSRNIRPSSVLSLTIDGNSAHSSGWWWHHAPAFYFGGALYYQQNSDQLEYNPGRSFNFAEHTRNTCSEDLCGQGNCNGWCGRDSQEFIRITNTKAFLVPSVGLNSWSGRMEVIGYECHDCGLALESLESGFWIDDMLAQCRTNEPISLPPGARAWNMPGDGFFWYDTDQEHIITKSTFRNCGIRSDEYSTYDNSPSRGCGNSASTGCREGSTVFGFLTHSSEFNPEIMQGTRDITFENCGRRFRLFDWRGEGLDSVSGRLQNWLDVDGSVTGFGEPSIIGSGLPTTGLWWKPDNEVFEDPQGPLNFIKLSHPDRGVGHFRMYFDDSQHNQVGSSVCTNGGSEACPALGYVKHIGPMFSSDNGLPVTAQADIAGPVGGFGWLLKLNNGAPRTIRLELVEVKPDTPLLLHVAYPPGTSFTITATAPYCGGNPYLCSEVFNQVGSVQAVRNSLGNAYYFSNDGMLTIRVIQFSGSLLGDPDWFLPDYDTPGAWSQQYAINRFERGGVLLPKMEYGPYLTIEADCPGSTYCNQSPPDLNPNPCPAGRTQVAYDKCCSGSNCVCADGNAC